MKVRYLLFAGFVASCGSVPVAKLDASARVADDLALLTRQLAEARTRYGSGHPELTRLEAAHGALLQSGHEMNSQFDADLREAIKYQLAIAEREGAELALRFGASHPERVRNAAAVAALEQSLISAPSSP